MYPNSERDGVAGPEEQEDGRGGPRSEMVDTGQAEGEEERNRLECMGQLNGGCADLVGENERERGETCQERETKQCLRAESAHAGHSHGRTHELGPESPAAVAGNGTRGHVGEAGDACEGGDDEDDEQRGENEAFFGAEGQVKVSQAGCPLPTVSVATLHEPHLAVG
jgi:hypothetical protein